MGVSKITRRHEYPRCRRTWGPYDIADGRVQRKHKTDVKSPPLLCVPTFKNQSLENADAGIIRGDSAQFERTYRYATPRPEHVFACPRLKPKPTACTRRSPCNVIITRHKAHIHNDDDDNNNNNDSNETTV